MRIVLILWVIASSLTLTAQTAKKSKQMEIPEFQCKVRLPNTINSYRPTIQPVLTPDGNRLYFDRKYHPNNFGSLQDCDDIWYADRRRDGSWSEPVNIGPPLNTRGCDVLFSISPDGKSALVGGVYPDVSTQDKKPGFSITTWNGNNWLKPTQIVIPNFYNNSGYFYASLSSDNKVLLFGISRNDGLGQLDIYCSLKDKLGNWKEPMSLGPTVNSAGFDVSPFLALDGKTLYFSSNRPGGYGKNDLYVTRRLDDTWQNWSEPKNLGASINTIADELSISINASGDTACIVSSDSVNQLEGIYFVCLPKDVRPQKVNLDTIIRQNKVPDETPVYLYFESNESALSESNIKKLQEVVDSQGNKISYIVTGFTDDLGTTAYNARLSALRAHAVKKYLHKRGVPKVKVEARGEKDLKGKVISEEERSQYRKVEIRVQKP